MHEQVRVAFSQLKAAVACRNLLQLLVVTWGPSASTLSVSTMGGRVPNCQPDVTDCHC